jgi:putative cofactor-binding repeat protein/predicted outer membrane repeat protein
VQKPFKSEHATRSGTRGRLSIVLGTIIAASGVTASATAAAPQPAFVAAQCRVLNLSTGVAYKGSGQNLQTAIDAASAGATLRIIGSCVGSYNIDRTLTLVGRSTSAYPVPTLDGNDVGTVLWLVGTPIVHLRNLTVTHGHGQVGGIGNSSGTLVLRNVTLSGNYAGNNGGAIATGGPLTLTGSTTLSGNYANDAGGGIYEFGGSVTMNDMSSITGNTARTAGGGIYVYSGSLTLNDAASISGNTPDDIHP